MFKAIVSAVIAALLLIGNVPSAPQTQVETITAPEPKVAAAPAAEPTQDATQVEAIALAHAGFKAEEVTQLHTKLDKEKRSSHYDVEFRAGDWEYDYEISLDGAVLKAEKEYDPIQTPPAVTEPAVSQKIGTNKAKSLALGHAGLTEAQVTRMKAELDYEDGVPVYEVEFNAGSWEYDYEIHATSGKILTWEKDLDD